MVCSTPRKDAARDTQVLDSGKKKNQKTSVSTGTGSCELLVSGMTAARKTHAQAIQTFAPVLEHGDFMDTRRPRASQLTVGGGCWNAGHLQQRRSLTCHLTVDADALAIKKNGGRALRNRRSSDGPRSKATMPFSPSRRTTA